MCICGGTLEGACILVLCKHRYFKILLLFLLPIFVQGQATIEDKVLRDMIEVRKDHDISVGDMDMEVAEKETFDAVVKEAVKRATGYFWREMITPFLGDILNPEYKKIKKQDQEMGRYLRDKFTKEGVKSVLGMSEEEVNEIYK